MLIDSLFSLLKDAIKHRFGQPASKSILLTGMITAQQPTVISQLQFGSMREFGAWRHFGQTLVFDRPSNHRPPRQPSQRQKNDRITEVDGSIEKRLALFDFGGRRLVVGRRTAANVGHHAIDQL